MSLEFEMGWASTWRFGLWKDAVGKSVTSTENYQNKPMFEATRLLGKSKNTVYIIYQMLLKMAMVSPAT